MSIDPRNSILKRVSKAILVLAILFLLASGLVSYEAKSTNQDDSYKVRDVVSVLYGDGMLLTRDFTFDGTEYKIGDIEPTVYKINGPNQYLLIYPYDSIGEREKAVRILNDEPREIFTQKEELSIGFTAKNMILIYMSKPFSFEAQNTKLYATLEALSKTIFFKLNKGTEVLYRGESENWEVGLLITYYENWWKDEQGVQRYESWSNDHDILRYKGNPDEIAKYEFRFEYLGRAFGGTSDSFSQGSFVLNHNYNRYGGSPMFFGLHGGGVGLLPKNGFKVTIKWNDNPEEVIELKPDSMKSNEVK